MRLHQSSENSVMAKQGSCPRGSNDARADLRLNLFADIGAIDATQWDQCAPVRENPFLSHAFLYALEASGSVAAQTGWLPRHLAVVDDAGLMLGCMPLYLKAHSQGEYVFDHEWANAFEKAGGRYYPKLQACVPFTPVAGPRILISSTLPEGVKREDIERILLRGALQICQQTKCSSLHFTFLDNEQWRRFGAAGLLLRHGQQFQWHNKGYVDFDAFLAGLSARKRSNLRRERASVHSAGIDIQWLSCSDISERDWDDFYRFYLDTSERKWNHPYLTRDFFSRIAATMGGNLLLIAARRGTTIVAATLNVIGVDTFYGRYWGCSERIPFLHFELCYYQAIDFAIRHSLQLVEAGAQGFHKLARGYLPARTFSAHYIRDAGLRAAVRDYLSFEDRHVENEIAFLDSRSPFKHTTSRHKHEVQHEI